LECICYSFRARGHPNVRATHRSTMEITVDDYLTPRGDCIIGVSAPHGAAGLPGDLKRALREGWRICILLLAGPYRDVVCGRGDERLELSDERRMIIRRSRYVEPATIMVEADKPAAGLDRRLVEELKKEKPFTIVLTAFQP